jgi:hypothetical protein
MNFIELTCKHNKTPLAINSDLIGVIDISSYGTHIIMGVENAFYQVSESYSEAMAKIHKAKRLEIASKIMGNVFQCCHLNQLSVDGIKTALNIAEELIKQNDNME